MAVTATKKLSSNTTGSPAQYKQSSRKGKKAWRKNVDIGEVETGLEEGRAEERETGSSLRSKTNDQLFQIDVKGDDTIRKHLPKFDKSQLSYNKALAQRSAVPALTSRPSTSSKKRAAVSQENKYRLLRIGKRKRLGPFDSVEDTSEIGKGSAILDPSHAVKKSGTHDVWGSEDPHAGLSAEKKDFLLPLVEKRAVKAPQVPFVREDIVIPAVVAPHAGASYNPPAAAHEELLRLAHEQAERKEKEGERYVGVKDRADAARKAQWAVYTPGVPTGMVVDNNDGPEEDADDEAIEGDGPLAKKAPVRKTKQQRKKADKQRAEKRALAERAAKKRLLAQLDTLRATRKSVDKTLSAHAQARIKRRLVLEEKLRESGMAGRRLGKHIVPEAAPDFQLGEDLSESLRGLKVEGNLFRDRFLSMQHRALLEPRVPVLPKRHRPKTKEVEKFAWKHFD